MTVEVESTVLMDNRTSEPPRLTREQVDHLRDVLVAHGHDATIGACGHCGKTRCDTWLSAYDQLASAGELMADPRRWDSS